MKTRKGRKGVRKTPRMKVRTNLLRKLKEIFKNFRSQPIDRIIYIINPILRGWLNYFRIGNSAKCFNYIKDWIHKKLRRHLMKNRKSKGFGWNRWNNKLFYEKFGLYRDYQTRYYQM